MKSCNKKYSKFHSKKPRSSSVGKRFGSISKAFEDWYTPGPPRAQRKRVKNQKHSQIRVNTNFWLQPRCRRCLTAEESRCRCATTARVDRAQRSIAGWHLEGTMTCNLTALQDRNEWNAICQYEMKYDKMLLWREMRWNDSVLTWMIRQKNCATDALDKAAKNEQQRIDMIDNTISAERPWRCVCCASDPNGNKPLSQCRPHFSNKTVTFHQLQTKESLTICTNISHHQSSRSWFNHQFSPSPLDILWRFQTDRVASTTSAAKSATLSSSTSIRIRLMARRAQNGIKRYQRSKKCV